MKTKHILLLLFIVSLGLRLAMFSRVKTFGTDQARDVLLIKTHIQQKKPIVLGPKASVGDFYLPPFYYYLISIPWILSGGHPYSATILNILIESCTPVIIYLCIKKFWHQPQTALSAALLYSFSPMVIQYASFAWNPNVIPFFAITSLYFLFDYFLNRTKNSLSWSLVLATLAMQLHYQGFILYFWYVPVFLYTIFIQKRSLKPWIKGCIHSLLTFIPLLFDPKTTLENINNILLYFQNNHAHIYQTTYTFDFFWQFMSRMYSMLLGFRHSGYLYGRLVLFFGSTIIGIKALYNFIKTKKITPDFLFIMFVICSFIGLRVYKGDKWEYFLSFLYFVPAITISLASQIILKSKAIIVICLAAFVSGISFPLFNRFWGDDVAVINHAKHIVDQKYQSYQLKNYYQYFDYAITYLWQNQDHLQSNQTNTVYVCSQDMYCHVPICTHQDKPEKELGLLSADPNLHQENWKVRNLYIVTYHHEE